VLEPGFHALVGADVVTEPGKRLANATVVVRDGRIVAVGTAPPPAGARVHELRGRVIHAAFVEAFLPVDAPAPDPDGALAHWNPSVLPHRSALDGDGASAAERELLRELGFAAAAIAPTGGVFRGTAAIVQLDEPEGGARTAVVRPRAYELCSFQTRDGYPNSQMGAIAVLRQTLLDADWHERCAATAALHPDLRAAVPVPSLALGALVAQRTLPLAFDATDELEVLRAAKLAGEFQRTAFVFGSGMEFRRAAAVARTGLPIVLPVHFPEAPDVSTIARAERVSLRQLWSWEQAPTTAKRLLDLGCKVAFTTARLPEKKEFRSALARSLACGVTAEQALAALTTIPAELLGVQEQLGRIAPGMRANLVVATGEPFAPASAIETVWVGGRAFDVRSARGDLDGTWQLTGLPQVGELTLTITGAKLECRRGEETLTVDDVSHEGPRLDCRVTGKALGEGSWQLHAVLQEEALSGQGRDAAGAAFALRGARAGTAEKVAAKPAPAVAITPLPVPLGGHGALEMPAPETVAITNVTIWTAAEPGIIQRGALLVRDGRIAFVGSAEHLPRLDEDVRLIDGQGHHVTPGLIDCHSHTGISRGVNESGQAVTAEVRVGDVIDPDNIGFYRELAGGVTTVNQLHGSANAIGGQSSTIKLRWGCSHPDEMQFAGARPGIKFALGENPRRANSDGTNTRYPNTRMGVEALIRDRFVAAAEYRRIREAYGALPPRDRAAVLPPRRDLELEALAEVLAGTRWIHCHSYRQDEILMLCNLAEEYGIRIGTFQHVLEGYKVAEAIARQAVGASSFSDWWAYKFEVWDAIPWNAEIMRSAGVCVSFNSDSDELARRLATEAGKAVKYGGVPPAEALKFVTINPATQLGIDDRTGSLARGKDADFVIWSGDPLSCHSRCLETWVDGRPLFTVARDLGLRAAAQRERQRLLQKAMAAGGRKGGERAGGDDAFWAAEDRSASYCCRECDGGGR
jgi:imidazolonepropionase-like amidohydrolase